MINLKSDYGVSAHPKVLEALVKENLVTTEGYGNDPYTEKAIQLIKDKIDHQGVDVHFLSGGTQMNLIALSAFLRAHEAVVSTDSAHIVVAETGAIEATGHKIYTVPHANGKLTLERLKGVVEKETTPFSALPKLVAITHSSEYGTNYTKKELKELYDYCQEMGLYLYIDGARLGTAMNTNATDVTYHNLSEYCDAFYIGGTKNGALYGEAIVIVNDELKPHFRWHMKQKGAMLSKGKPLAQQFITLFEDGLFDELATHANEMANLLRDGLRNKGYSFYIESETNLLFVLFPDELIEELEKNIMFSVVSDYSEHYSVVRLVTSFSTTEEEITTFLQLV